MPPNDAGQIPRLIRSLSPHSPVRQVAESLTSGVEPPADSLASLIGALSKIHRTRWKEQVVAAWCLGRIPLAETDKGAATRALIWPLLQRPSHSTGCFVVSGCLFTYVGFIWIAYTSAMDGVVNKIRAEAAKSLGLLAMPEAAEPLVEAVAEMKGKAASGDRSVRVAAAESLSEVLKNLPDSGYGQFSNESVAEICKLLNAREEPPVYAALNCLRMMGGGSAVDPVERIAAHHKSAGIRDYARQTMKALLARRETELQRSTLLRATTQPAIPGDELLRPAATVESDPSALLRPSSEDASTEDLRENPRN